MCASNTNTQILLCDDKHLFFHTLVHTPYYAVLSASLMFGWRSGHGHGFRGPFVWCKKQWPMNSKGVHISVCSKCSSIVHDSTFNHDSLEFVSTPNIAVCSISSKPGAPLQTNISHRVTVHREVSTRAVNGNETADVTASPILIPNAISPFLVSLTLCFETSKTDRCELVCWPLLNCRFDFVVSSFMANCEFCRLARFSAVWVSTSLFSK